MSLSPLPIEVETFSIGAYAKYALIESDAEASRVVELLQQLGAEHAKRPSEPEARDLRVVTGWLSEWAKVRRTANKLIFWVGHGEANPDGAWLAVHETDVPMAGTGIKPEAIADHICNQWTRRRDDESWAAIVIEACGAERFVRLLNAELCKRFDSPKRLVLFGAGGHGQSFLGGFSAALSNALRSFTDNDESIRLDDLLGRVRGYFTSADLQTLDLFPVPKLRRKPVLPSAVTVTVDVYLEMQAVLQGLSEDERSHFVPKAQGAEQGELAWYFTGRSVERQFVCDWLRASTQGMLVVTGRAGSGKSALLGNVLVYSTPALRQLLVRHKLIDDLPESQRPPDDAFSAVIHLTGLTTAELVKRLLAEFKLPPSGESLNEWLEQLVAHLQDRTEPFVLMADALDESQEPVSIAASVLRRLAGLPGCRVLVGTRRSTKEGPDQPDTDDENLINALGRGEGTRVLEVTRDSEAIGRYVHRRLEAARSKGVLPTDFDVDDVVRLIQAEPGRQFLYARLAVHELLARPELTHAQQRSELVELLANDHRRLFAQAVARLTAPSPKNGALLEALAMAMGRGLPRADRIWAVVAQALMDPPGTPVNEQDIDDILQSASPYIMLDAEDGQSVYRLAHRTFQEHFVSAASHE